MALLRARLATAAVAIVTVVSSLILGCGTQRDQYPTAATVLVWVPGGVSDELASSVEELEEVTHTSEVLGGTLDLVSSTNAAGETIDQTTPGRTIPLDTLAYDPTTFSVFTDASTEETLSSLKPDEAILGATSARLRGSGVGGSLLLASGRSLTIRAVLDDHRVAGAEVVVSPATALELNVDTRRLAFRARKRCGWSMRTTQAGFVTAIRLRHSRSSSSASANSAPDPSRVAACRSTRCGSMPTSLPRRCPFWAPSPVTD